MSTAAKLQEIEDSIKAQREFIACVQSDLRDPARLEREVERLEKIITQAQKQITAIKTTLSRGQSMIDDAHDRIYELQEERKMLQNKRQVERLLELAQEMEALKHASE